MFKGIAKFFKILFTGKGGSGKGPQALPANSYIPPGPQDGSDFPSDNAAAPIQPGNVPVIKDYQYGTANVSVVIGPAPTDGNPVKRTPRFLWCLDNGHGKATPGKRSPLFDDGSRLFEYELVRDVNKRIMEKLDAEGVKYFNVVPETEVDIPLPERTFRANSKTSDLPRIYLSIHSNANGTDAAWDPKDASGVETWYLKGSAKGVRIASVFQKHLQPTTGFKDRGIKCHSDTSKAFYVLKYTTMPAVLTESGFYTCKEEATQLKTPEMRQKIADGHVAAILEIEEKGIEAAVLYSKNNEMK